MNFNSFFLFWMLSFRWNELKCFLNTSFQIIKKVFNCSNFVLIAHKISCIIFTPIIKQLTKDFLSSRDFNLISISHNLNGLSLIIHQQIHQLYSWVDFKRCTMSRELSEKIKAMRSRAVCNEVFTGRLKLNIMWVLIESDRRKTLYNTQFLAYNVDVWTHFTKISLLRHLHKKSSLVRLDWINARTADGVE